MFRSCLRTDPKIIPFAIRVQLFWHSGSRLASMKGDDIADRLLRFARRVLRICRKLPDDFAGKHVSKQLIRSSSGAGSNYEEARGAESSADFVHKLGVSRKEMRESLYWLRLSDGELLEDEEIGSLTREANELTAILTSSMKTAKSGSRKAHRFSESNYRGSQVKEGSIVGSYALPTHE